MYGSMTSEKSLTKRSMPASGMVHLTVAAKALNLLTVGPGEEPPLPNNAVAFSTLSKCPCHASRWAKMRLRPSADDPLRHFPSRQNIPALLRRDVKKRMVVLLSQEHARVIETVSSSSQRQTSWMRGALFLQSSRQALGTPRQNLTDGVPHVRGETPNVFQTSADTEGSFHMMWCDPRADGSCALLQAQLPPRGTV